MITIEQIRAARGLLDWSQEKLATEAGLSLRALNNLERGVVLPRVDTLAAIKSAFERADVEFLEDNGVRLKTERLDILKFEGAACIEQLTNDILETFQSKNGEILLSGTNESKFSILDDDVYNEYHRRLVHRGITGRILSRKGEETIVDPPPWYRWIDPRVIGEVPYFVYGNNLALIIWEPHLRLIIIRNSAIASTFRRQFEVNWASAEIPPFVELYEEWPDKETPWTMAQARAFMAYVSKKKSRVA
jgi:transcriptional regulator with XRE-family HTH domain